VCFVSIFEDKTSSVSSENKVMHFGSVVDQ